MEEEENFEENDIALALSGGGIRSAALSSGVLRRLLQKDIKINYLSCVSGGNYTAAAYLDWKFRHGNEDDPKWHQEFFDHMRTRAGYFCHWTNCMKGIGDTLVLLLMLIFVNLLIPFTVWGGMAFPVAYLVDFMFGDIMRAGFDCSNMTIQQRHLLLNENITKCANVYDIKDPGTKNQVTVFIILTGIFLFLYLVKAILKKTTRVCTFLQLVAGVLLGLVFIPWFMQQFTDIVPIWLNVLIFSLSFFFWCGFPPLRNYAALAVIFYVYGYITKWRVYHSGFIFDYQEYYFYTALLAAGVALWTSPYLGVFNRTAIYNFGKWRLQLAFFTRQSVGRCGCNGITCSDFFPVLSTICNCSACNNNSPALTMADIIHTKPKYISNVLAEYWRREAKEVPETMIGLCSKKIEIITEEPGRDNLNCKLKPSHIQLADAMSTAAMITKPARGLKVRETFEYFRELQLILGLAATNSINTEPDHDFGCKCEWFKIVPIVLQSFAGAPIIFLAVIWLVDLGFDAVLIERLVMIVFVSYVLIFAAIAMLPTGGKKPWFAETIVRWCHVHLYHVRFLREILKVNNVGPLPPALLSLSDVGGVEKYGLLPLFKRRMKKIVIVDGSFLKAGYAKNILRSMQMAREMFYCEFIGYEGHEVIGQLYKNYVSHPSGKLPRSFRFLVKYFDKTDDGFTEAGQGEILLLSPRHPEEGFDFPSGKDPTWGEYTRDTNIKLDPKDWGPGSVLTSEDTDRLTLCCCECCHHNVGFCRVISSKMCSEFPIHSTINQFFTPSQFSAYHREGYRACIEADVETFLSDNGINNV